MFIIFRSFYYKQAAWLAHFHYEVESDTYFQILPIYVIIFVAFIK